jgi:RNA polymerase sigma-70 factor, ECF subfamily
VSHSSRETPPHAADGVGLQGDETLDLRVLFDTYYTSIWRLLRRLGVPRAQVDDAAQEVFWVAARRLHEVRPGSEHPFLYGVALRVAANERRRVANSAQLCGLDQSPDLPSAEPSPEDALSQRQARESLDLLLAQMDDTLRTVFVLAELEHLEVKQIAELEQIPLGTASSRLRRAREEFSQLARRLRARTGALS